MATTITGTTIDVGPNKLVADSAGNVGIGTASPLSKLDVSGGFVTVSKDANTAGRIGASEYITGSTANDLIVQATGSGVTKLYQSGVNSLNIDAAGIVTKPLQPAFLAQGANGQNNIGVGFTSTILLPTERFDNNNDFSSNTFTAPVTGKYQLNSHVYLTGAPTNANYIETYLTTSNRNFSAAITPSSYGGGGISYISMEIAVLADMDAGDTAFLRVAQGSGTQSTDVTQATAFSGYLVA